MLCRKPRVEEDSHSRREGQKVMFRKKATKGVQQWQGDLLSNLLRDCKLKVQERYPLEK